MYVPYKIGQPKNILILRVHPWGDLLTAVPAFRAWEFVKRFLAYLDDFIPFPGFPGFSDRIATVRLFPSFLNTPQKLNFDLASRCTARVGCRK